MHRVYALHEAAGNFATPARLDAMLAACNLKPTKRFDRSATAEGRRAWLEEQFGDRPLWTGLVDTDLEPTLTAAGEPTEAAAAAATEWLNVDHGRCVFAEINEPYPEGVVELLAVLLHANEMDAFDLVAVLYDVALAKAECEHLALTEMTSDEAGWLLAAIRTVETGGTIDDEFERAAAAEFFTVVSTADGALEAEVLRYVHEARRTMAVAQGLE